MSTENTPPPVPKVERRFLPARDLRAAGDGELPTLVGYGALFGVLSQDLGYFIEKIDPGAFRDTIAVDDIRALVDHCPSRIIGRNRAGTLRLMEDAVGLAYEIDPPDTSVGRDISTSIRRGDVTGSSFGFETLVDQWDFSGVIPVRTLIRVKLYDVGPVTFPAYVDTTAAARSLEAAMASARPPAKPDPLRSAARARRLIDLAARRG